jgi:hypothetical protein
VTRRQLCLGHRRIYASGNINIENASSLLQRSLDNLAECAKEWQLSIKKPLINFASKTAKISVKKLNQFLTMCKGHRNIG